MSILAVRIRQARRHAQLTQDALAEQIGINRSAVAQWERNGGSRPTSENLAKIAVVMKVNFDWLATGRGKSRMTSLPAEETAALDLRYFAHSDLEERLLMGFRAMSVQKQVALVQLVDTISGVAWPAPVKSIRPR